MTQGLEQLEQFGPEGFVPVVGLGDLRPKCTVDGGVTLRRQRVQKGHRLSHRMGELRLPQRVRRDDAHRDDSCGLRMELVRPLSSTLLPLAYWDAGLYASPRPHARASSHDVRNGCVNPVKPVVDQTVPPAPSLAEEAEQSADQQG